jgi:transcriptional regulator with XRE-family HTH domain
VPAERLSTKLRRLRLSAGLTQHETARRAGISVGMLRDLEQGRTSAPRRASLAALAGVLGVDPSDLADRRAPVIRINILGPLELLVDGTPTPVGGHKQAVILGMLALHANE